MILNTGKVGQIWAWAQMRFSGCDGRRKLPSAAVARNGNDDLTVLPQCWGRRRKARISGRIVLKERWIFMVKRRAAYDAEGTFYRREIRVEQIDAASKVAAVHRLGAAPEEWFFACSRWHYYLSGYFHVMVRQPGLNNWFTNTVYPAIPDYSWILGFSDHDIVHSVVKKVGFTSGIASTPLERTQASTGPVLVVHQSSLHTVGHISSGPAVPTGSPRGEVSINFSPFTL